MTANFEEILQHVNSGPWNWLIYLLCSLWGIVGAMQAFATAFLGPVTDHWCRIPELSNGNWTRRQIWNYSMPWDDLLEQHSQCFMYERNYSEVEDVQWNQNYILSANENLTITPCTSWDYDTDIFHSTIVSEWNLVCHRGFQRSFIQSIFMLGVFVGAPIGGLLADKLGRKKLMMVTLLIFIVVSVAGSFSPNYPLFLVCRFLMALTGNCVYQTSYILAVEACTPRHRSIVGILFSVPFGLGCILLPGLAYLIRDWRHLHMAISFPVIVLIANTIILPESPRWLIQRGKIQAAEKELQRAARWNGTKNLDMAWLTATMTEINANSTIGRNEDKSEFLSLLRTPGMLTVILIVSFNWITSSLVYYGISLNSANLSADPFLYMFFGGLAEIPSYTLIIPFVVRYGRKVPLMVFFGVTCITVLIPLINGQEKSSWWFLTAMMTGKLSITSAFQVIFLYCSELFPTNLRTQGLGLTSMVGRTGAIFAPFVNDILGAKHWSIPSIIFGCMTGIAMLITCYLPETNNIPLPETPEDLLCQNNKIRRNATNNGTSYNVDTEKTNSCNNEGRDLLLEKRSTKGEEEAKEEVL